MTAAALQRACRDHGTSMEAAAIKITSKKEIYILSFGEIDSLHCFIDDNGIVMCIPNKWKVATSVHDKVFFISIQYNTKGKPKYRVESVNEEGIPIAGGEWLSNPGKAFNSLNPEQVFKGGGKTLVGCLFGPSQYAMKQHFHSQVPFMSEVLKRRAMDWLHPPSTTSMTTTFSSSVLPSTLPPLRFECFNPTKQVFSLSSLFATFPKEEPSALVRIFVSCPQHENFIDALEFFGFLGDVENEASQVFVKAAAGGGGEMPGGYGGLPKLLDPSAPSTRTDRVNMFVQSRKPQNFQDTPTAEAFVFHITRLPQSWEMRKVAGV